MSLAVHPVTGRGFAVFEGARQISLCFYSEERAAKRADQICAERAAIAEHDAKQNGSPKYMREQNQPKPQTLLKRRRKCVTCFRTVDSEGPHHRMCVTCRSGSEYDGSA